MSLADLRQVCMWVEHTMPQSYYVRPRLLHGIIVMLAGVNECYLSVQHTEIG